MGKDRRECMEHQSGQEVIFLERTADGNEVGWSTCRSSDDQTYGTVLQRDVVVDAQRRILGS